MTEAPRHHNLRQSSLRAPGASELSMTVHQQYLDQRAGLSLPKRSAAPIAVIDRYSFTRECTSRCLRAVSGEVDIVSFATCDEACQSHQRFSLIIYHSQHVKEDFKSLQWHELLNIAPAIVLGSEKVPDFIVNALRKGIRGYIPIESTTFELAVEIFRLVMAGGSFIPLAVLPFGAAEMGSGQPPELTCKFTAQEKAVLTLLKRGKANKIIAFELDISESTVKVHIRNIMRKVKVTNRTEIVSRIYETLSIC
jgi:DNA-binding NarL/FixJ family response regulator